MFFGAKASISYSIDFNTEGGIGLKTDEMLEYIQLHCNLNYISDIRNPIYLKECLAFLNEIDNDAFTIQQWRYLCEYITGQECSSSAIDAIRKIINSFSHRV